MLVELAILAASVVAITLGSLRAAVVITARDMSRDPRIMALEERRRIAERKRTNAVRTVHEVTFSDERKEARKAIREAEDDLVAIAHEEMEIAQESAKGASRGREDEF